MADNPDIQRVRESTDIVRLIQEHVSLKQKGREFVGLCPFHDDHSPSMNVSPSKQIYKCFSCGAGGDVYTFVQEFHGMSFAEALKHLADRAGIELTARGSGDTGRRYDKPDAVSRKTLYDANAAAASFFGAVLKHEQHGRVGRELIASRGIDPETAERFGLGLAPEGWDRLASTVAKKQLPLRSFVEAGLLKPRGSGSGVFDTFRNRLVFPIHDLAGRVIAFGARKIDPEDEPKYLNSPESEIFKKAQTLYGIYQASGSIRSRRRVIVTEGYTDTIACHQSGFPNTVATLGTAFTAQHAKTLSRIAEQIVLLFDADQAGQAAAERAVEVLLAEQVDVRIATIPADRAKDPDELLKQPGGDEVLRGVIESAEDPLDILFGSLRSDLDSRGANARARAVERFIDRLVQAGLTSLVPGPRKQFIVQRVAHVASLDWESVQSAIAQASRRVRSTPAGTQAEGKPAQRRPRTSQEHLLACMLIDPNLARTLSVHDRAMLGPEAYSSDDSRAISARVWELVSTDTPVTFSSVLDSLEEGDHASCAVSLVAHVERITDQSPEKLHHHWRFHLEQVRARAPGPGQHDPPGDPPGEPVGFAERVERIRGSSASPAAALRRPKPQTRTP